MENVRVSDVVLETDDDLEAKLYLVLDSQAGSGARGNDTHVK